MLVEVGVGKSQSCQCRAGCTVKLGFEARLPQDTGKGAHRAPHAAKATASTLNAAAAAAAAAAAFGAIELEKVCGLQPIPRQPVEQNEKGRAQGLIGFTLAGASARPKMFKFRAGQLCGVQDTSSVFWTPSQDLQHSSPKSGEKVVLDQNIPIPSHEPQKLEELGVSHFAAPSGLLKVIQAGEERKAHLGALNHRL